MYPILFKLGPITIYTYGFALAVGFLAATWLVYHEAGKEGLDTEKLSNLVFYAILSGIIGSRVLFILMNPSEYLVHPLKIFKLWEGGLVFYGGILGGILATLFMMKKYRLPYWKTLDILAPGLIMAQAIGRMGCFMAGCCYGKSSDVPWAVIFKNPKTLAPIGIPLHPTQLYHSIANLTVFCVLFYIMRKRKSFSGQIFSLYLCLYSLARFWVEFFRGDSRIYIMGRLNLTQGFSLMIFLSGIFLYWRLRSFADRKIRTS